MNSKFLLFISILILGTASISCDKDDDQKPAGSLSPIIEAELPTIGTVGQEINFMVNHTVMNGCGQYSSQETTQTGSTLTVTFYAGYREGPCTMDAPVLKTNYKFTPTKTGIYTFKFKGGQTAYLVKTIQID